MKQPASFKVPYLLVMACIVSCFVALYPRTSLAEEITYGGNPADLKIGTIGGSDGTGTNSPGSLFPGTASSPLPSGNTVTIDFTAGVENLPYRVFGGMSDISDVKGNTVKMQRGNVFNSIYGGYDASASGMVSEGNMIIISGGTIGGNAVAGQSLAGTVSGNSVSVTGGTVTLSIYGGSTNGDGGMTGNSASVDNGNVTGSVYGGISAGGGTVSGNAVSVTGGNVNGFVYGGVSSGAGVVSGNTASISEGTVAQYLIAGLSSGAGQVSGNDASMTGGDVKGFFFGGWSQGTGNVDNNSVSITAGTVGYTVYGGYSSGPGDVLSNVVSLLGGTMSASVMGGSSSSGVAMSNTVSFLGGTVAGGVMGGRSISGDVVDNRVIIGGSGVTVQAYYVYGGYNDSGGTLVRGNSVVMYSGNVDTYVIGGISLGSSGDVTENLVNFWGGKALAGIMGGAAELDGVASHNTATVSGGETLNVYGGESKYKNVEFNHAVISGDALVTGYVVGGGTGDQYIHDGMALYNDVTILGGIVKRYVYGGSSQNDAAYNCVFVHAGTIYGDVIGGNSSAPYSKESAYENKVVIMGGNIHGNVYGGRVTNGVGGGNASYNEVTISGNPVFGDDSIIYGGRHYFGTSTHNTVTVSGSPQFGINTVIYGGYQTNNNAQSPYRQTFIGNTLKVLEYSGNAVSAVSNFENYEFLLHASGAGALKVTGVVDFTQPVALGTETSQVVGVNIMGGGSAPQTGDSFALINAGSFVGKVENDGELLSGKKGATMELVFRIVQATDALYAVLEGVSASPVTKVLSEGFLSGAMLVNQGGDLAAGPGTDGAVQAASTAATREGGTRSLGFFSAAAGGRSRYESGSHVGVSSYAFMAGLSFASDLAPGRLTLGVFAEHGNGSYATFNSFPEFGSARGEGDSRYFGGGVLGRMDFNRTARGSFHVEASLRAGRIRNTYETAALGDPVTGLNASFDSTTGYFGAHAGLGFLLDLSESATLDIYVQYFWTRVKGDSVELSTGDRVEFKDFDSHRVRVGTRLSWCAGTRVCPYIGAAYEHELDGKAGATVYGSEIPSPSMKGATGMGELGLSIRPSDTATVSIEIGAQGFVGKRQGVTGSLRLRFDF
jgi:hypothetical protein